MDRRRGLFCDGVNERVQNLLLTVMSRDDADLISGNYSKQVSYKRTVAS